MKNVALVGACLALFALVAHVGSDLGRDQCRPFLSSTDTSASHSLAEPNEHRLPGTQATARHEIDSHGGVESRSSARSRQTVADG